MKRRYRRKYENGELIGYESLDILHLNILIEYGKCNKNGNFERYYKVPKLESFNKPYIFDTLREAEEYINTHL